MDVSVVVPVYNSSRFLHQCVDSLINQTLKDVEFIFVDDGSTDDSFEILQQYQEKDSRIRILRQENMHAGVARNNGMKQAAGKYIIFLDSDDFFEPDMLESAFRCAEDNRAEIVIFGFDWYDMRSGNCKPYKYNSTLPKGVFSVKESDESLDDLFFERCYAAPWNKLYLRSFIERHDLQFQSVRRCNDIYFVFISVILAERIKYLDRILVNYRINNPDSLQGSISTDRESYIDCGVSVKKKTIELNRYHGIVKASLNAYVIELVRYGMGGHRKYEEFRRYYDYVKQHLIPGLFDSPGDFSHNQLVTNLYMSRDFAEFLFLCHKNEKEQMEAECVSKKSKDYRIGHAILCLPRLAKSAVTKFRTNK